VIKYLVIRWHILFSSGEQQQQLERDGEQQQQLERDGEQQQQLERDGRLWG
jgi:hypothetical protein